MRRNSDTPQAATEAQAAKETQAATEAPEAQSGAELVNPYRAGADKEASLRTQFGDETASLATIYLKLTGAGEKHA